MFRINFQKRKIYCGLGVRKHRYGSRNPILLLFLSVLFGLLRRCLCFGIYLKKEQWCIFRYGFPFSFFFSVGLYFLFGRFVVKTILKKSTYYVITDKRVCSISQQGRKTRESFIDSIPAIYKRVQSDGRGTVEFGNLDLFSKIYGNTGLEALATFNFFSVERVPVFYDIKDANEVYEIVRNMREKMLKQKQ